MSCSHPNVIHTELIAGKLDVKFIGPAKGWFDPRLFSVHFSDLADKGYFYSLIPCGKCPGCRMDYSRTWANRMLVELHDNDQRGVFLTLTYNAENLPYSENHKPTLSKRDLQLFWKRLRKAFRDIKIRYFVAGEYGPKTHRPHYHAIVFGLSLSDFVDLRFLKTNALGQSYWTSPSLERIWGNGYIVLSEVTWHTCAYVSRYVLKKRGKSNSYVVATQVEPEFNLSSRKPGIGLKNAVDMVESGLSEFTFDGNDGVYTFALNRAFYRSARNVLEKAADADLPLSWIDTDSDAFQRYLRFHQKECELHNQRMDAASDKLLSKLALTEATFDNFLKTDARKLDRALACFDDRSEGDLYCSQR